VKPQPKPEPRTKVTLWITEASPVVGNQAWALYVRDGIEDFGFCGLVEVSQHKNHREAIGAAETIARVLRGLGTHVTIDDNQS